MSRDYKQFAPKEIYHVFNRGVAKIDIFNEDADYLLFMDRLQENLNPPKKAPYSELGYRRKLLPSSSFKLICYCLMPNHFHLVIHQETELPISKLMSKMCTGYVKYFNKKYDRVGGLFQDQYKAVRVTSDMQLKYLLEYIHLNPVKGGIVDDSSKYKFCCNVDGHLL